MCRTVKHTWSELGHQLSILATLHAEKAKAYLNEVRQPLLDLVPKLEEARREVYIHAVCIVLYIPTHNVCIIIRYEIEQDS